MGHKIVSDLLTSAKAAIDGSNISGIKVPALSVESLNDNDRNVVGDAVRHVISTMKENLGESFTQGNEAFSPLDHEKLVEYSMRMVHSVEGFQADLSKKFASSEQLNMIAGSGGHMSDGAIAFGNEAFDGAQTNNALYFTLTYNLMASRQDEFTETLYPIVMIDPTKSGINVEADIINLISEFTRSTTGGTDGSKFGRTNIVKAISDADLLTEEKNRIYPVKTTDNASAFISYYTFSAVSSGETITTAPIKANTPVSLLGLSQSAALIAKGLQDSTDSLDRALSVSQIYFTINGNNGTIDVSEHFQANVDVFSSANFTYTPQDHDKDLQLNFPYAEATIVSDTTLQVDGSASALFTDTIVATGTVVKLQFRLGGYSNTQSSDTEVYCSGITIKGVWDVNGNQLAAGNATYDAIVTLIEGDGANNAAASFDGYVLKAYRTNLNMRTYGHLLTSDIYTQGYAVPILTGIAAKAPNTNAFGPNDDGTKIMARNINLTGAWMNMAGARAITSYAASLKSAVEYGKTSDIRLMGMGAYYVDAYYAEDNMDVSTYINSISSKDRQEDIRATIMSKIKDMAVRMITGSKYLNALRVMAAPGTEPTVIIATDVLTASYIGNSSESFNLAPGIKGKIVSTNNSLIVGKIYMTLGVFDGQQNAAVNPLHFGNCLFAPTVSAITTRSDGNATFKALATYPRYSHINNLPVMSVISISGLDTAVGSVSIPMKTVV